MAARPVPRVADQFARLTRFPACDGGWIEHSPTRTPRLLHLRIAVDRRSLSSPVHHLTREDVRRLEPRENGHAIPCVALRVLLDRSRQHRSDDVILGARGRQLDRSDPNDLAKIAAGAEPSPHGALEMAVENAPRCSREARNREPRERLV